MTLDPRSLHLDHWIPRFLCLDAASWSLLPKTTRPYSSTLPLTPWIPGTWFKTPLDPGSLDS